MRGDQFWKKLRNSDSGTLSLLKFRTGEIQQFYSIYVYNIQFEVGAP